MIVGIPNYKTIKELYLLFSANAASVYSNRRNGSLGHLALSLSTAVQDALAGCSFSASTNPGATVEIPANTTAAQTYALTRTHKVALNGALKKQVLASVHPTYYRGLRSKYTCYRQISTRDLLVHLFTTYGEIGPGNLEENEKRMKEPYDATNAVEVLIDQIKDTVEFADSVAQPYIDLHILRVAFNL